jgi:dTDP-4-dehydrorhamnose reductase
MKVLVTGSNGMLGSTLAPYLKSRGNDIYDFSKENLDITDYSQVQLTLSSIEKLDLVIHCGAYTKVDQAESEPELAYLVNGYGTENLAVICNKLHVPMLFVSTDYVFDGETNKPYRTWDATNPLSVYGKSKLAGELAVQRHLNEFYIIRTSWLYGPNGNNFVETMKGLAKKGGPLKVVSDQTGSPTSTLSLSRMIGELITRRRFGVYHVTDSGVTNWFDFACEITKDSGVEVIPITTKEMPRPARRPTYSVLDKTTLISTIDKAPPSWQESLKEYLELSTIKEAAHLS